MLAKRPNFRIVSREVKLATGEVVRAFFAVADTNGVLEVKFLGTKPLESQTPVALLENAPVRTFVESSSQIFNAIASPFVSSYDFLINNLTRAPSFN